MKAEKEKFYPNTHNFFKKIRSILVFFFMILITNNIYSQHLTNNKRAYKKFNKAKEYYFEGDNTKSLEYCDKAIKIDTEYTEPLVLKAQILSEEKQYNPAIKLLKKVISLSPNYKQIYFIISKYLMAEKKYDEAQEYLQEYIKLGPRKYDKKRAQRMYKICKFRNYQMLHPVPFNPQRLDSCINTQMNEYFPTISADNKSILFTRLVGKGRHKQEDIYISRKDNLGHYDKAVEVSPLINTQANEGAHCLSEDGMEMIFTRCTPGGSCDLYISRKDVSGYWMRPEKMPYPINTRYWESQPSLSPDNKTLYFVSNRPGGKGKMDIWKSKYLGKGKWSKPVNLGDSINTANNEMSPFIHFDNKTLYFASDGHIGMGKFDLFVTKKINDTLWSTPKNLGYPINSSKDEYRIVVTANGQKAFYSTVRDSIYKQDIYEFTLYKKIRPQRTLYVKAYIYREPDYHSTDADQISIINLDTKDTVFYATKKTCFMACLPINGQYALNILKKNYLFYSKNFSLENIPDTVQYYQLEIYLKPILAAQKFKLNNLFYKTDSYTINPKSYVELNKLVEFLKINSKIRIKIEGHTDNVGSYQYNINLSQKRAKSVAEYLIAHGIDKKRIEYQGYGYTKPIASNNTEKGRQQNRRTEILILQK
jgi:outer membrane protein OmpA-like peptidoglycan-associated protein